MRKEKGGEVLDTLESEPYTDQLVNFVRLIKPYAWGWRNFLVKTNNQDLIKECEGGFGRSILKMVLGTTGIYCMLFATGFWLYGTVVFALILTFIAIGCTYLIFRLK